MFHTYLPDVVFHMRKQYEDIPFHWVRKTTSELFGGKKVVIFGLPGAFTPTCSNEMLPNYELMYQHFVDAGVDEVWCTSVNDAFSMYQWAKQLGIKNVKMLPDGNGEFAKGLGYLISKKNLGFGDRSWRYALLVDNLNIERWFEEDGVMDNCPTDPYEESKPETVLLAVQNHTSHS